jgi:protein-S-isoprenylcysteine O-methyltransferase Ste14
METTGAFRYLRHPLYASFLLFFVGLAYWLDHWVFVLWAVTTLPIWYLSAVHEEKLMRRDFPDYEDHFRRTPRFIPGLW